MIHSPTSQLLAGTRNPGKIREIRELLLGLPVTLRSVSDFTDLSPVDEVGETYEENSSLKALSYAAWTGLPTLADDSGLEVEALGGMPGVLSARFGGDSASDSDRIQTLLSALDKTLIRRARFVCCLTLAGWDLCADDHETPTVLNVSRAEIEGQIAMGLRGGNGFGYDPVFVPDGYSATLAELPIVVKNNISHRARAFAEMRTFLERWIKQT